MPTTASRHAPHASDSLKQSIDRLDRSIRQQNSLSRVFVRAIVAGVGSALGASLVAGIVVVLLARILQTIDYIPFISGVISSQEIQDALRGAFQSP